MAKEIKKVAKEKKPVVKKTAAKMVGIYADTWDTEKTTKSKAGLYLDTWLPEGIDKTQTHIYADTWVPVAKKTKGVKTGIYADTWVPSHVGLKIRTKK